MKHSRTVQEVEETVRAYMLRILFLCVIVLLIFDFAFFVYFKYVGTLQADMRIYFLHRVVAPSFFNVLIYVETYRVEHRDIPEHRKNIAISLCASMIGGVVGFFHSYYIVLWLAPSFGLLFSTIIREVKVKKFLLIYSYVMVTICAISITAEKWGETVYNQTALDYYMQHMIICYVFITVFYSLSTVLRNHIDEMVYAVQLVEETNDDFNRRIQYDALTAVYSRDYIGHHIETKFLSCTPEHPITLGIIDIDDFKKINDNYGHASGDVVLKRVGEVGKAIGITGRKDELFKIARYGGEEFLLIFNERDKETCEMLMKLLLREFSASSYAFTTEMFTLSGGMVTCYQSNDFATVFQAADHALYAAKTNGKNQVVVGDDL